MNQPLSPSLATPRISDAFVADEIDPNYGDSREKRRGLGRSLVFALTFLLLIGGSLEFMVYKVHGDFDLTKINGDTFSAFFKSSPAPIENQPRKKPKKVIKNRIAIQNSATNVIRNINNESVLIISGNAINQHPTPRKYIRVKVSIYSSAKAAENDLVAEKEVWAGNTFSRKKIANFLDQESIDRAFHYTGRNSINLNIASGESIPFQIIVLNPPNNWREFSTTATSQPVSEIP